MIIFKRQTFRITKCVRNSSHNHFFSLQKVKGESKVRNSDYYPIEQDYIIYHINKTVPVYLVLTQNIGFDIQL